MKTIAVIALALSFSVSGYSQDEPSKNMPPISMLPKKGKKKMIYELSTVSDYKVYNSKGKLVTEGNGQFIDCDKYKKGDYFVIYGDKKETFHVD